MHVTTPETKAGIRIIPMFNDVKRTLLAGRLKQVELGFTLIEVDGYAGFIFQNRYQKEKKIESFANLEGKIKTS